MLTYTKAAGKKILQDLQKIALVCSVVTQLFYIFYLLYATWNDIGVFYIDLVLLILYCAYFGFFLYNHNFGKKKEIALTVKSIFKWSKRLIKLVNLGIMIYGIVYTATKPDALSIVLTALVAILWLVDLLLEIAVKVIKSWWQLFLEGIQADLEVITKPVNTVSNFFKKVTGKEVEEPSPPTKRRLLLNRLVEKVKRDKREKKLETKYLKSDTTDEIIEIDEE